MKRSLLFMLLGAALVACRSNRDDDDNDLDYTTSANTTQGEIDDARSAREANAPATAGQLESFAATDRDFLMQAAQGALFEVEASRVALMKATSNETRDFANMMVADHGRANQELDQLVRSKGGMVSERIDGEHQSAIDQLRRLDGPAFERQYYELQVTAHDEAIRLFDRAARGAQDPDLRSFANRTLPTLRKHRDALEKLRTNVT